MARRLTPKEMKFLCILSLLFISALCDQSKNYRAYCNEADAIRTSVSIVHRWASLQATGDPDTIIKNYVAEDALLFYIPDIDQCAYLPVSIAVGLLTAFANAIKYELVIKNIKYFPYPRFASGCSSSSSSNSCSEWVNGGFCQKPAADTEDGDVVISTVAYMNVDGMNPGLYNMLFYLRAQCGCDYKVYRQVITPYACLATIAGKEHDCMPY
jgi:hypothetical protein